MLKKMTLAVLGLAASGLAMAGTMGPVCAPDNVTVPCEANRWDIGVQALYLRSSFGAAYGYDLNTNLQHQRLGHDWDWGYRLEGSYHFSTGNDLTVNWMHYATDFQQAGFSGFLPMTQTAFTNFTLQQTHTFDQVNAVLGQYVDFGLRKNIRFYAGLQYADIRVDADNLFNVAPAATQYRNTDFNGVGAVLGTDFSYELNGGFSLTANAAMSILYGTGRYSDGFIFSSGLVALSNYGSKKMLVPALEAKLGANYAYPMAYGVLNIEGGYQAMNYFSALQTRGPGASGSITNSDYALYGPYLGAKWLGYA